MTRNMIMQMDQYLYNLNLSLMNCELLYSGMLMMTSQYAYHHKTGSKLDTAMGPFY